MTAWVYILTNKTHGTLYTGVTTGLVERIAAHRDGRGSAFANAAGCTRLVWYAAFEDVSMAIQHEKRVKRWQRAFKIDEIEKLNPEWRDLFDTLHLE